MPLIAVFGAWLILAAMFGGLAHGTEYRAAAIEHVCVTPVGDVTNASYAAGIMHANLDILAPKVAAAAADGADLVVLSEMAMTSLNFERAQMALFLTALPDAHTNANPCTGPPSSVLALQVFQRLACVARDNNVYLVANWGDRFACPYPGTQPCPLDGHLQFNTELAFAPTGALIGKYFKRHTFNATEFDTPVGYPPVFFEMTPPRTPQPTTPTGVAPVRIGLAVCFDSMYPDPVLPLLHDYNVSDFVFSHWWVDQYASMAATPWFTSLSRTLGINIVFAASVWERIFPWGSGSGIVARGVPVNTTYRTGHLGVVPGNDILLTGNLVSISGAAPLADVLPRYTAPIVDRVKPLPMCIADVDVTADELNNAGESGIPIRHEVTCQKLTCNLTATVSRAMTTSDASARWVLMAAYGYYHMADGGGVYYYEDFCGFFQCNSHIPSADCLAKHWHSIDDDRGGRPFVKIDLIMNAAIGSMPFVMAISGDGTVAPDYNTTTSVRYAAPSLLAGLPVEGPTRSSPVAVGTASPTENMLGTSLLARSYELDMRVEP